MSDHYAITRADWSRVTLGQYAALAILRRDDSEALLNAYWDSTFAYRITLERANHVPAGDDDNDVPVRLTDEGKAWLAGLHDTVTTTLDEREQITAATEFVRRMGTLLTMNIGKAIK